jgi:hypothetical protein
MDEDGRTQLRRAVRGLEQVLRRHRLQPASVRLVGDAVLRQRLVAVDEGEELRVITLRAASASVPIRPRIAVRGRARASGARLVAVSDVAQVRKG